MFIKHNLKNMFNKQHKTYFSNKLYSKGDLLWIEELNILKRQSKIHL